MATENVRQPDSAHHVERIDLARQALNQIEVLVDVAQEQAAGGGGDPDLMLGLLGRVRQMTDAAVALLVDVVDGDEQSGELVQSKRSEILGRREASHV